MNQDTKTFESGIIVQCECGMRAEFGGVGLCKSCYDKEVNSPEATTDHDIMRAQLKAAEERVEELEKGVSDNVMTVSFVPYSDDKWDFIVRDGSTLKEVTLQGAGWKKGFSQEQMDMLYKLAPMCVYTHYNEVTNKQAKQALTT